jgi:hypothetical protein
MKDVAANQGRNRQQNEAVQSYPTNQVLPYFCWIIASKAEKDRRTPQWIDDWEERGHGKDDSAH